MLKLIIKPGLNPDKNSNSLELELHLWLTAEKTSEISRAGKKSSLPSTGTKPRLIVTLGAKKRFGLNESLAIEFF